MRFLLAVALILLFLWLHTSNNTLQGNPCVAEPMSEAAVSVLLSPLSLYSWLTSMLLRLVLSVPALVLTTLYHSLLLLLAWPWCLACISASLLLTCLHVALYLLHMALVVGAVAVLILTRQKTAGESATSETTLSQQKKLKMCCTQTRLRMFDGRTVQQG